MESRGLISVIIPVYNVEKYLQECVDSVLNQTYQNFEIILVDDGSKDNSPAICDAYAVQDERIRCIHKENGGASSARNIGIVESDGEYIYFLDSDDLLVPEAFSELEKVSQKENADIVFFEADAFTDLGNTQTGNYRYGHQYVTKPGPEMLAELILNNEFHVSIPLLFIRKRFLCNTCKKMLEGIMYEDMVFTLELFHEAAIVAHCKQILYHRRYRSASVMTAPKKFYNYMSMDKVYWELLGYMTKNNLMTQRVLNSYMVRCAMNCLELYSSLNKKAKEQGKESIASLKKNIRLNKAFHSKALWARCYGKIPWVIVRSLEKIGVL